MANKKKQPTLGTPTPCTSCENNKNCRRATNCGEWRSWFKAEWRAATLPLRLLKQKGERGRGK